VVGDIPKRVCGVAQITRKTRVDFNRLLYQLGYLLYFLGRSFYWFDISATLGTVFQLQLFYLIWLTKSIACRGIAVRGSFPPKRALVR
jgi:hypothetical protein